MKIAIFYTTWTESVEKIVAAGKRLKIKITPIHYSQVVWRGEIGRVEPAFNHQPLSDFSVFYFRTVGDKNISLPSLLAYALEHKIRVVDQYLTRLGGAMRKKKSNEAIFLLKAGVSYPASKFVGDQTATRCLVEEMKKPVIVKSISGRHGTSTFLIRSDSDLDKAFRGRRSVEFLIQDYIPNDGDYRLFLVGYKVIAGFKRQIKEEKLVLNRSQGPSVFLEQIPLEIKQEAEKAAKILGVEIAGVDLVIDQRNQKPAVIEVNQAPEFRIMEKRTNIDVAAKIVKYLASKKNGHGTVV